MRRALLTAAVLMVSTIGLFAPSGATPTPPPLLDVAGTDTQMYPTFDPAIHRYAITTTANTAGTVTVSTAATDPGSVVFVDGRPATSSTTLAGLAPGDEISVIFAGTGAPSAYSVVYLPPGFPAFAASGSDAGAVAPGYLGVGLTTFAGGTSFEGLLDRNGVPAWVNEGNGNDFKRQPNGELSVMRNTTGTGTGVDLVTLNEQLGEIARRRVVTPLTDTDNHDSERLADGSTILIGYEPRGDCGTGYLDATIQKQDADGNVVFSWNSHDYGLEVESLNATLWPQTGGCQRIDYAHINSIEEIPDGTHDVLVSFRQLSAVYRIATAPHDSYSAGDIVWRLGGRSSTFSFDNGDGGPCAQHDATWVGPNRVLLFDNGSVHLGASAAGCVDPADTSGPGIARNYTRVSEYALNTGLGTATLAWSYVPTNTFTFFAGSASRLTNGDTLVGWASDRQRFATEVDKDANELWSLTIPGNTQNAGYTSYRVSLVEYTDATAPVVAAAPDGGVYVSGDSVEATYSCTDKGGSNLQSCTSSGLSGGDLDTTTPGAHTWQVTATDGAGNTTTATRHYIVRSGRQPDGLVRKAGSTLWKGGSIYGSTDGQTVAQRARRGHTISSYWQVRNNGERSDSFSLGATPASPRYRVHYLAGGVDVTAAVVAGTYRTAALTPGQSVVLTVKVTPRVTARIGSHRRFTLTATSAAVASAYDRVAIVVTTRS